MKPVEPAELSGYLDGELDVARTAEVRELLSRDAALLAQFEALRATDANWRAAAASAAFVPRLQLPAPRARATSWARIAALALALIALRVLPKLGGPMVWGIALHAVALAIALVWIVRMIRSSALHPK